MSNASSKKFTLLAFQAHCTVFFAKLAQIDLFILDNFGIKMLDTRILY